MEVAALVPPGRKREEILAAWPDLASAGIHLHLFPVDPPVRFGRSRELTTFVETRASSTDILHLHGVWEGALVSAAAVFAQKGKPYIISPHGMLDNWSMARSKWKKVASLYLLGTRRFLKGARAVVYGTRDEADAALAFGSSESAIVVPNGIDTELLNTSAKDAEKKLQMAIPETAEWDRTILFYGRLHPKKGIDLLIEAFDSIAASVPNVGLLIAGISEDKSYENLLRQRVARSLHKKRIIITTQFVGPESRYLLDAVDLFVLPSHQEGFSIAIIEAMARGLPVLITVACHLPEVEAVGAGRVVPVDIGAITKALSNFLSSTPQELSEMGAAGRDLVVARFTWKQVAATLEHDAYEPFRK